MESSLSFCKTILYDEGCDESYVSTLIFRELLTLCEMGKAVDALPELLKEAQQNQTSVVFATRFFSFLATLAAKKEVLTCFVVFCVDRQDAVQGRLALEG